MARRPTDDEVRQRIIPDGDPAGSATVQWDSEARGWYHVDGAGNRVWHAAPAGFHWGKDGALSADEEVSGG